MAGDFNMIYRAEDKNNDRIDRWIMGLFRHFLNISALKELHLSGHLFTWSNERTHPLLERIDRDFASNEWEAMFPDFDLHALASHCSNHAPMLLRTKNTFIGHRHFHFMSFWPKALGFFEVLQQAWNCPLQAADPFYHLDWLLQYTTKML
jgi:hypothetical protein